MHFLFKIVVNIIKETYSYVIFSNICVVWQWWALCLLCWKSTKTTLGLFQTVSNCPCRNSLGIPFFNLQCSFDASYKSTLQERKKPHLFQLCWWSVQPRTNVSVQFYQKNKSNWEDFDSSKWWARGGKKKKISRLCCISSAAHSEGWCMRSARVHVGVAERQSWNICWFRQKVGEEGIIVKSFKMLATNQNIK